MVVASNNIGNSSLAFPKPHLFMTIVCSPLKHSFLPAEILQLSIKVSFLNGRTGGNMKKKDLPMNEFLNGIHK